MRAPHAVRRFLAISWHDRGLALSAWTTLGLLDLALRVWGFQRTVGWIERSPRRGVDRAAIDTARRWSNAISMAAHHHVVPARCLHRSLALHAWLRLCGLPSELQIGVRKEDDQLLAHAWVMLGSQIVNDGQRMTGAFTRLAAVGGHHPIWSA